MAGNTSQHNKQSDAATARRELTYRDALSAIASLRQRFDTIEILGADTASATQAALHLGWNVALKAPVAFLVGEYDGDNKMLFEDHHQVIVVCGGYKVAAPAGWRTLEERALKDFRPLGERCATIARRLGLPSAAVHESGRLFTKLGVASVVGSRLCALPHPTATCRVFVRASSDITSLQARPQDRLRDACMTVFGIGRTPLFAANFASLATVLLAGGIYLAAGDTALRVVLVVLALISTALGVAFENWSASYYFAEDAREVVLDEVAGMSLVLLFLPASPTWLSFFLAFLLFRFFDIFKWGIHWIEETKWPGTIVWDDILAGLYAGLVLKGCSLVFNNLL